MQKEHNISRSIFVVADHQNLKRSLSPSALSQDFVEVEGDGVLGDESFDFDLQAVGQDPHQSLGSETVLGALLVVA